LWGTSEIADTAIAQSFDQLLQITGNAIDGDGFGPNIQLPGQGVSRRGENVRKQ